MAFNSIVFLEFAVVFFLGWRWARKCASIRFAYITGFSFLFYSWANPWYVLILIGNGLVAFYSALWMDDHPKTRQWGFYLSLSVSVGILVFFKYLPFLAENLTRVLHAAGVNLSLVIPRVPLPVGVSFYTFMSMTYIIDVYRGLFQPTRSVLHYFAYLSMFPHLVAGPVVRARDLLPQLLTAGPVPEAKKWEGCVLIARGLFKKMVLADNLAPAVAAAFGAPEPSTSMPFWWVMSSMFAMQVYCDFSGYTDIARGLAKWMGYEFAVNFDHPYSAVSIRDFWNRWHISLSSWFRDYIYIPLGGSKCGPALSHRNMWITMILSGLWHGANWTFVMWGMLHAAYLSIERATHWPERVGATRAGRSLCTLIVFVLVTIGWVFFRSSSLGQALSILGFMFNAQRFDLRPLAEVGWPALFFFAMALLIVINTRWGILPKFSERQSQWLQPAGLAFLVLCCIYWRGPGTAFIYFQF